MAMPPISFADKEASAKRSVGRPTGGSCRRDGDSGAPAFRSFGVPVPFAVAFPFVYAWAQRGTFHRPRPIGRRGAYEKAPVEFSTGASRMPGNRNLTVPFSVWAGRLFPFFGRCLLFGLLLLELLLLFENLLVTLLELAEFARFLGVLFHAEV